MIFRMYINLSRSFYRFVTIHACDRQTDGQRDRILIAIPRLHSMQRGKKNVGKMKKNVRTWKE